MQIIKICEKYKNSISFNAGVKAPSDIEKIIKIPDVILKLIYPKSKSKIKKCFKNLYGLIQIKKLKRDNYILQYPNCLFVSYIQKQLNKKGTIYIIHDLRGIRSQIHKIEINEVKILSSAKFIISHNQVMTNYLISQGINSNKIVNLELFDYLCDEVEYKNKDLSKTLTIAYAGNIDKALFIKQLDESKMNFEMNLYGVKSDNLQINDKLHYIGKETPERLPNLIDANLGLVWDGNIDSSDESDILKNYTKYNNPHKVSCYLAAGIPVIVWSKSAIWNFVKDNNCGYAIDNIYDINNLDLSDYEEKRKNAIEISKKVRSGYYTKKAFNTAFEKLGLEERIK